MNERTKEGSCVTRLGDLLEIGQLFESIWQQLICPNLPTFLGNFCKGVKIFHFSGEIIFCNFKRPLTIFSGHTGRKVSRNKIKTGPDATKIRRFKPCVWHSYLLLCLV